MNGSKPLMKCRENVQSVKTVGGLRDGISTKEKAQAGQTPVRLNTDAVYDGGLSRSSDEVPVMGMAIYL
jgi:hypothetical protein